MATRLIFLLSILCVAFCACSEDENPPMAPAPPANARYVDAAVGDDGDDGSSGSPWATITHALATAGEGFTIYVAPATYDVANGESFPIMLQPGQQLIGDVNNKGMGAAPTRIRGEGLFDHFVYEGAVVVGAQGARVAGFAIVSATHPRLYSGIVVTDSVVMEIDHNTLENDNFAGIVCTIASAPDIHDNLLQASDYCVIFDGAGAARVHDNVMEMTFYGVSYGGPDTVTGAVIENNTITATSMGVQGGRGTVTIRNNRFEHTGGYFYSAIRSYFQPSPTIRGNWFASGPVLWVQNDATPDVGTQTGPGQNDFSAVTGTIVEHEGSGVVMMVGNTWANSPPALGTDIVITGTGSVVWE